MVTQSSLGCPIFKRIDEQVQVKAILNRPIQEGYLATFKKGTGIEAGGKVPYGIMVAIVFGDCQRGEFAKRLHQEAWMT
jgi:hypothetical protein